MVCCRKSPQITRGHEVSGTHVLKRETGKVKFKMPKFIPRHFSISKSSLSRHIKAVHDAQTEDCSIECSDDRYI